MRLYDNPPSKNLILPTEDYSEASSVILLLGVSIILLCGGRRSKEMIIDGGLDTDSQLLIRTFWRAYFESRVKSDCAAVGWLYIYFYLLQRCMNFVISST